MVKLTKNIDECVNSIKEGNIIVFPTETVYGMGADIFNELAVNKIYDYKNNIRPAPDPHFLLDKFYGNLSIQEYRKLLKTQHMLLVIDKPMTRMLPELHDDNDETAEANGSRTMRLVLVEGKKRQIRRMVRELVGWHVVELERISIGSVHIGTLPKGKWRPLTEDEVKAIFRDGPRNKRKSNSQ